jgi:nifR3 family TIM-barrel protein
VDIARKLQLLLTRQLQIGTGTISQRLLPAPMSYVGNVAFRQLLIGFGGDVPLFSEMCSARRVPSENPRISSHFRWTEQERPRLICQLLGKSPDKMAEAARRVEQEGLFGVDINFGCSATAVCRRDAGAAVLKSPRLAQRIVAAVRNAVKLPLWIKFRTGWVDDPQYPVDLARRFEDAGADALTFHPRVAPDRRSRPPKWAYIARVKGAVGIPVFGNGNVFNRRDCLRMLDSTGCDGVSLGRLGIARPWVFSQWTGTFTPDSRVTYDTAKKLLDLLPDHFDAKNALGRFKRFCQYFAANFRFGHTLFSQIQNASDLKTADQAIDLFFSQKPELTNSPNLNYFT